MCITPQRELSSPVWELSNILNILFLLKYLLIEKKTTAVFRKSKIFTLSVMTFTLLMDYFSRRIDLDG